MARLQMQNGLSAVPDCIGPLPVICSSAAMNNTIALAKKLEQEHGFNRP